MMKGAGVVVQDALYNCAERGWTDRNHIKSVVKDKLSDFFWKKTQRRPMVLPMILEI